MELLLIPGLGITSTVPTHLARSKGWQDIDEMQVELSR